MIGEAIGTESVGEEIIGDPLDDIDGLEGFISTEKGLMRVKVTAEITLNENNKMNPMELQIWYSGQSGLSQVPGKHYKFSLLVADGTSGELIDSVAFPMSSTETATPRTITMPRSRLELSEDV